jgi:hypothetical protein
MIATRRSINMHAMTPGATQKNGRHQLDSLFAVFVIEIVAQSDLVSYVFRPLSVEM